jgi:flagellin-like protein
MRKGVSPLVAAVLLIAITMTIAAILSYWASGFVRSRTTEWEKALPAGECSFANFQIYTCRYDSSNSSLMLILENVKDVELTNITAYIVYGNGTIDARLSGFQNLPGGQIKAYNIYGVDSTYDKITIKTQCSDVSATDFCK